MCSTGSTDNWTCMIAAHGVTHRGRVRHHNEDSLAVEPDLGLFVVADGMGGENAGEVASQMAVDAILAFVTRSGPKGDHTWPFGIDGQLGLNGNRLRTAIKIANRTVFKESESQSQFTGMGTTVAALLVDGSHSTLCGIGDSRIYSVQGRAIKQLTRDHTWVATLLSQNPHLDPAALARHPMRHVLTSVVGAQIDVEVPIIDRSLLDGERLLLCTDGIHRALSDERLCGIVASAATVETAAEEVVATALEADGSDNLSALVVAYRAS